MPGHFNSNFLLTTAALLVILLGISSPVLSLPYPPRTVQIQKQKGPTSGRYTVKLKHGVNVSHFIKERNITNSVTELPFFDSFFAPLQASQLTELSHDPNVTWIAEDGVIAKAVTRQRQVPPDYKLCPRSYNFADVFKGHDIYNEQPEFTNRVNWGPTYSTGLKHEDVDGHGTHCACIAAGDKIGAAREATHKSKKNAHSIISLSGGGPAHQGLEDAALETAAGNENTDAATVSPARLPYVITVGASDIEDQRWMDSDTSGSNYGPSVNLYAPGSNIKSCGILQNDATPHVAGLIARRISHLGDLPPPDMIKALEQEALKNVLNLKDVPEHHNNNRLAHIPNGW
ncbi:hypothetical protein H0H92_005072 [Tricholoma furcatifolium]|nr:hypothetical protein H0H92_005072 [Tricholoma furcatifolium]